MDGLKMKCGCPRKHDDSGKVFGKQAANDGDMAYCPKHGNVRLVSKAEYDQAKAARRR